MNMYYEKFLQKIMKHLNEAGSIKELCEKFLQEIMGFTKASACWIYLHSGDNTFSDGQNNGYLKGENFTKSDDEKVKKIFQLAEDLFVDNYDIDDTLDYFCKLSKDDLIIVPIIVKKSLFGYFAILGKDEKFNSHYKDYIETLIEILNFKIELFILNDDLAKQDKEKIQFLASISHEYKTPLNSIIGFSDILKTSLEGTPNFQYIDNISKSAKFLLSLIQDILDMARSEFSQIELNREVFRPKEVIEDIIYSFNEIVNSKNLHFSYTIMDVEINADLRRFKQVIYNLISNAVKFNKLNGKITIVSYINDKREFVFEIKDNGDGISKKDRDKIFNFFSQVNPNYLKRQQGSGIGLALCKKIVEAHGGTIDFKSRTNCGSTFWFIIPQDIVIAD